MKLITDKNHVAIIIVAWVCIYLLNLDVLYVNIMEARNFITAREMWQDGQWILTKMDGLPRYEKPPLPTWFAAFFGGVFGFENVWALRIPSALITLFLLLYFRLFSLRITQDKEQSLMATLILATSFYIIFGGRNGTWDIFCHSFMLAAIYFLFKLFETNQGVWKHALFAGVLTGASFMSKGPISHFALLLPFLIAYGVVHKYRNVKVWILPLLAAILVSTAISAWWPYVIYLLDSNTATAIAEKETASWQNRNVRPIYYYWSFFTQSGVWTIPAFACLLYPYLKTRVSNLKGYQFAIAWTLAAVVLLSLVPEKKSRYLLPVLIPLAMTLSFYVKYLSDHFTEITSKWERLPVIFNYGLISLICVLFPIGAYVIFGDQLEGLWIWFIATSVGLLLCGVYLIKALRQSEFRKLFYGTIVTVMVIMSLGFPLAKTLYDNPAFRSLEGFEAEEAAKGITVYNLNGIAPELLWDYGSVTKKIQVSDSVSIPSESVFGVLTQFDDRSTLERVFEGFDIEHGGTFDLNPRDSSFGRYKTRIKSDYYIIKRKQ